MNEPFDLNALAAALEEPPAAPDQDPGLTDVNAPTGDADTPAEPLDAQEPEPDADDKNDKNDKNDDDQELIDVLTVLGPDGEPEELRLDDILTDTLHDVEVGGEALQVSYEDLRKGYMQHADYTAKTEELARKNEELGPYADMVAYAKNDPNFVQYLQQYFIYGADPVMGLTKHKDISDAQLSQLLASDNPEDLAKAKSVAAERAQLRQSMGEQHQRQQRVMQERQQLYDAWKAGEERRAREVIPNYDSVLKGRDAYLKEMGFAEQEISSLADHRLYKVLADALAYRETKSKGTSKQELTGKRKHRAPSRSISSGRGKSSDSKSTRTQKAEARARETGRTEDWANVLQERLGL